MGVRIKIEGAQRPKIETLADVKDHVLCTEPSGDLCWKDMYGKVIRSSSGKSYVSVCPPKEVIITRVIGPFRIVVDPE